MAAPNPDELKKIQELLSIIDNLYKKIGEKNPFANFDTRNISDAASIIGQLETGLKGAKARFDELTDGAQELYGAFKGIVNEIKNTTSGVKDSTKSYSKLGDLARKLRDDQKGISQLSSKELESIQSKIESEVQNLRLANEMAQREAASLVTKQMTRRLTEDEENQLNELQKTIKTNNEFLGEHKGLLNDINTQVKTRLKEEKEIEKALGVTGALMKSMSKIPFLGDLPGMSDVLKDVEDDIRRINKEREAKGEPPVSRVEAMSMAFKKMGPVIKEGLNDPLIVGAFLLKQLKSMFLDIDNGAGELAKNMNMSYKEALNFRGQLSNIATLSGDVAINTKGLQETTMAINKALGSNAEINEEDLKTFTKLREQAGYTNEELVDIYKISKASGTSIKDTAKSFLGGATALASQKGLAINVKQLMKETAGVSNAIKLSIAGGAKGLAEAAVKAKEMGINLEQADKIAGSLLNFEDSISAELEAELLTGKQLNLETARLAALNGDIGTMAEEINNQIGGSAEFSKMNRIQQEAFAKAVGMSREELANSLVEQEALQRTGFKTAEAAKARYEELRKTMSAEEAAAALGDEQLAKQYEQQNVQERFTQAVEKLKDVFISIVDGPLGTFMGVLADILSNSYVLYGIIGALAGLMAGKLLTGIMGVAKAIKLTKMQSLASAVVSVIKGAWETFGPIPLIGAGLAAAAAITGVAYLKSQEASAAPGLKDGGTVIGAGSIMVGEEGPEILSARPGATVTPLSKVNAAQEKTTSSNTSSPQTIVIHTHVMLDKKEIATAVNQTNLETQVKTQ